MFTIIGADGKEYGPVAADQIRQWIAENRLTRAMSARREGETEWRPLGEFPEFAAASDVPPAAPGLTAAPATDVGANSAPPVEPAAPLPPEPLVFTGRWDEYFKIWIVNVLLTIVTLGIYAAWAKVRKRRYFYAHTRLFGHAFEYLADPVRILYGNLIVAVVFLSLSLSQLVSPFLYLGLVLVFSVAVPWFIVRALAFNARNTAWRGLRFNFSGTYGQAAMAFLLWPMMVPFTFGLLLPVVIQKQKTFLVNRHAFGATPFAFNAKVEPFFKIYGVALLFFLPVIVAYFGFIAIMIAMAVKHGGQSGPPPAPTPDMLIPFGILLLCAVPLAIAGGLYVRARVFNLVWNHTVIAGHRFAATMRVRDLLLLHLVNSLVTLLTIGLMYPWAAVRKAKFQLDALRVLPAGNVDAFVAGAQPPGGAVGDSASDFFSFDIGFGV
jgi:uncharacterized membrane protein YjgN (DUF898 family)